MTEVPSKSTAPGSEKYRHWINSTMTFSANVTSEACSARAFAVQAVNFSAFLFNISFSNCFSNWWLSPDCVAINKPELIRVIIHVGNSRIKLQFDDGCNPTHKNCDLVHWVSHIIRLLQGIWADGGANWGAPCCHNGQSGTFRSSRTRGNGTRSLKGTRALGVLRPVVF